jgi:hypothetical protein
MSRDAALVICGRARDAAEARELLDMCGFFDGTLERPVAGPGSRSCTGCGLPIRNRRFSPLCVPCHNLWLQAGKPDNFDFRRTSRDWATMRLHKSPKIQKQTASLHKAFGPRGAS